MKEYGRDTCNLNIDLGNGERWVGFISQPPDPHQQIPITSVVIQFKIQIYALTNSCDLQALSLLSSPLLLHDTLLPRKNKHTIKNKVKPKVIWNQQLLKVSHKTEIH